MYGSKQAKTVWGNLLLSNDAGALPRNQWGALLWIEFLHYHEPTGTYHVSMYIFKPQKKVFRYIFLIGWQNVEWSDFYEYCKFLLKEKLQMYDLPQ